MDSKLKNATPGGGAADPVSNAERPHGAPAGKAMLHVSYRAVVAVSSVVPAVALLSCAAVGTYLHWEKIVHTHCLVDNFLPSVSAIIGHYHPERYIWRVAISLVCFPKLIEGYLYYRFFEINHKKAHFDIPFTWLNMFNYWCHLGQWVLLLTVSYVSSKESNNYHNFSFCLWLVFSTLHMLAFLVLYKKCALKPIAKKERMYRMRQWCLKIQVAAAIGFLYLGYRHNTYCEPNIYSYLALCEYVIGAVYTAFHLVAIVDFELYHFCILTYQ